MKKEKEPLEIRLESDYAPAQFFNAPCKSARHARFAPVPDY
jgi:hypothetical protein